MDIDAPQSNIRMRSRSPKYTPMSPETGMRRDVVVGVCVCVLGVGIPYTNNVNLFHPLGTTGLLGAHPLHPLQADLGKPHSRGEEKEMPQKCSSDSEIKKALRHFGPGVSVNVVLSLRRISGYHSGSRYSC